MSSIPDHPRHSTPHQPDKSIKLGRPALYYGHCRWCLVATVSLLWLIMTRDLELIPIVGLATYFVAHFPAKWLALHTKASLREPIKVTK